MFWIGYWMIGVATLHTMLGMYLYGSTYADFLRNGGIATVTNTHHRLALWFIVAGLMMFLLGLCFQHMPTKPLSVGLLLLGIAVFGILLLPKSGFWFLLPPAIAIIAEALRA